MHRLPKILIWITIFSITMGFVESSVVVYLRALYYPTGFTFPLHPFNKTIGITEVLREFATLIMLICAGYFSGKSLSEKFAGFIYSFAIWDIFYYIFLKLLINWPESLYTWDILFLLPLAWVGPVVAPVITSLTMIFLAIVIFYFSNIKRNQNISLKLLFSDWLILVLGSLIIIVSFTLDYCIYLIEYYSFAGLKSISFSDDFFNLTTNYIPKKFNWIIFWIGELVILTEIFLLYKRQKYNSLCL